MKKTILFIVMGIIIIFLCTQIAYAKTQNYTNQNDMIGNDVPTETTQNYQQYYEEHDDENTYYNCGVYGCYRQESHTHNYNRGYCNGNKGNGHHHSCYNY